MTQLNAFKYKVSFYSVSLSNHLPLLCVLGEKLRVGLKFFHFFLAKNSKFK